MIARYSTGDYANRTLTVTGEDGQVVGTRRLGCPLDEPEPLTKPCAYCQTPFRPYRPQAHRFCSQHCQQSAYRRDHRERINRQNKETRIRRDAEAQAGVNLQIQKWAAAHREQILAAKRAYAARVYVPKFRPGDAVTVLYAGFPCRGVVVAKEQHRAVVRLLGGTELEFGNRRYREIEVLESKEVA